MAKLNNGAFDVVLLDLALGGESGLELLVEIKSLHQKLKVIMMTGYGTLEDAVKAIKRGALDFIAKPISMDHLQRLIHQSEELDRQESRASESKGSGEASMANKKVVKSLSIITEDESFLGLLQKADKLAHSHLPILILGESGTGKELLAHYIHECSQRKNQSLVQVNCASFTETLLESELFGHEKGSFTGADQQHCGVFETADGGTLHLDEIADMALGTQAKVLRALQEGEIKRVGATQNLKVDLRVIASTHGNLKERMELGAFRPDLYYRLSAAILTIPPLRDRRGDIPLLVRHFFGQKRTQVSVDSVALKSLCSYSWPGNVRELKNAIEFALAVCSNDIITAHDLPEEIVSAPIRPLNMMVRVWPKAKRKPLNEFTVPVVSIRKRRQRP